MDKALREEIKRQLRHSLQKYVSGFKYKTSHPLDLLIPKERKIRSLIGGLETSMGTRVWEPVAKTLAKNNGFELIEGKILGPSPMPEKLASELAKLITARENKSTWISSKDCVERLRKICRPINRTSLKYVRPAAGTGVDIYFRKNGIEYAYDTKTVQPNLGSIKSFNKQILEWYAYRICKDPEVKIECRIAYPYNPFPTDFWSHTPHTKGIMEHHVDAVLENEFWDFLSGMTNTYQHITEIFEELNAEGLGKELSDKIALI